MTHPPTKLPWKPLGDTGVHYWLLKRMAKTCDIDVVEAVDAGNLDTESWADMVQSCRSCQWVDGCTRWLDTQSRSDGSQPPADCVNANLLRRLAEGQHT